MLYHSEKSCRSALGFRTGDGERVLVGGESYDVHVVEEGAGNGAVGYMSVRQGEWN